MLAGKKLIGWSKFKSCQLIDRGWHGFADRRLDRGYWDLNVNLDALIDCHSVRPLLTNWDSIVKLVEHFLSARAESIVHQYVTKLKEACSIPTT
jgi:hypothetical protein